MSLIDRFLVGFRSTDRGVAEPPGLVQNEDGTVDYIGPDGSRTPVGNGGSLPAGITSPGDGALVHTPTDPAVTALELHAAAGAADLGTPTLRLVDEHGNVVGALRADSSVIFAVNPSTGSFMVTAGADVDSGDLLLDLNSFSGVSELNAPHSGVAMLQMTHVNGSKTPVVQVSTVDGADAIPTLAFYGAAPVEQPVVPLTAPTVQNVIDALVALGLVTQSD